MVYIKKCPECNSINLAFDEHKGEIICTDCGTVESFDNCDIKNLSKNVLGKSSKFKAINQHSLEFFGVCESCAKS